MNGEFFGGGLGGGRTGRGGPGHALGRQAHQERQRRQQHNHAAEHRERVLVAEHGGLAQHDLVSLADGSLTGGCGGHPVLDQDLLYAVHEQRVRRAAGTTLAASAVWCTCAPRAMKVVSSAVPALPPRLRAKLESEVIWLVLVAGTPT